MKVRTQSAPTVATVNSDDFSSSPDVYCESVSPQDLRSLLRQIGELTRSNSELEQFASIIAHDLRSPLFSLSGCAQMLAEEDERLSEDGQQAVRYILESVRHMNRLITSLLERARAGQSRLKRTTCRVEQVLADVVSGLRATLESAGAQVTHDPLPVVEADPVLIAELLQNLLENAAKYRSSVALRIHVSARKAPGEWVFSVRDNGMGILPADLEKIFQLFERLQGEGSAYGGLGVGLAVCRQIVARHGGRIWAESRPGQGATFSFSLPDCTDVTHLVERATRHRGENEDWNVHASANFDC